MIIKYSEEWEWEIFYTDYDFLHVKKTKSLVVLCVCLYYIAYAHLHILEHLCHVSTLVVAIGSGLPADLRFLESISLPPAPSP